MAEVPTSGMMLRGRGPHRRRRYIKQESEVPSDLTTVDDLVEWVGDDKTRAQAVLDQEVAKDDARVTLVSQMESVLEPETPAEEAPAETPAESQPEQVESPETESSQAEEAVEVPAELTKVADLLGWVGDDKARAQAVLDKENAKPESEVRVTLVSKLTSILEADLI